MDLLNVVPTSDTVQSRGEATRSYAYSPHFLYSPHILYPSGYMYGIFPDVNTNNLSISSNNLQTESISDQIDILPTVDNRSIGGL